jgi:hypothetical protein
MKIIISPAKVQKLRGFNELKSSPLVFPKITKSINKLMKSYSKDEIKKIMKVSKQLLEDVHENIHQFQEDQLAINLYSGIVFKEINLHSYNPHQLHYLEEHLCILSALYGVLKPSTAIKPYRLDFSMGKFDMNLYERWKDVLNDYFKNEKIVNLASLEFSKLIDIPMLNIHFKEEQSDGSLKVITVRAKKARGLMVDYMVSHVIENLDDLKFFDEMGYEFSKKHSTENDWLFFLKYE